MDTLSSIQSLAAQYFNDTRDARRHLHQRPELSFHEQETAAFISDRLTQLGITHRTGVGGHGVVAEVHGNAPGPTVVLRADIDALPITEETALPYASRNAGVMHACGHDAHTACLLTAIRILNQVRERFPGSVRALFQPAEEKLPGGAQAMIAEGVLEDPQPLVILGQHINPALPSGFIGVRSGTFMASVDDISITVSGSGGHAAMPDQFTDVVFIASQIVVALQQVASRHSPPDVPTVLTIGRFIADGSSNVVPSEVKLKGTFRTVDESWREKARHLIKRVAEKTAEASGARCEIQILEGYPSLVNDEALSARVTSYAVEYVGADQVQQLPLTMGGEDFAYYTHRVPGCFYNIGVCPPDRLGEPHKLHSAWLELDEAAMSNGSGMLAWAAVQELTRAVVPRATSR